MLIDDILSAPILSNVIIDADWAEFRKRLESAAKFVLAPDFAAAAETLGENFDVINSAVPFCRLPFENVWVEVAQEHRPRFCSVGIHLPAIQKKPRRVGFLLSATNKEMSAFKAHQFWMVKDPTMTELTASHMAMSFDPAVAKEIVASGIGIPAISLTGGLFEIKSSQEWKDASPVSRAALTAMISPDVPSYNTDYDRIFGEGASPKFLFEVGAADWAGESVYLLAVLALLNTVNAAETRAVDNSGLNRSRAKRNVHPLANHYLLTISPRLKERMPKSSSSDPQHRALRAHMVRGHWKVRRKGIYFWRPFMRGDRAHGEIEKGYKIK